MLQEFDNNLSLIRERVHMKLNTFVEEIETVVFAKEEEDNFELLESNQELVNRLQMAKNNLNQAMKFLLEMDTTTSGEKGEDGMMMGGEEMGWGWDKKWKREEKEEIDQKKT